MGGLEGKKLFRLNICSFPLDLDIGIKDCDVKSNGSYEITFENKREPVLSYTSTDGHNDDVVI